MYQYDDPTCVATLPTPAAAGTPGYFTNGSPSTGQAATILSADYMNAVMLELINVVKAAGLSPSKTAYNQVVTAVKALTQQGVANVGIDTGMANACVVAFSPALAAPIPWAPFWFEVANTNTGASTLNTTGTAYPLVGAAHAPLQGGELVAKGNALVYWNPTLSSGAGAYVLIECSGGASQLAVASYGVTPPQFDNGTKLATTAFVQRTLGNMSGVLQQSTGGGLVLSASNAGQIIDLPLGFSGNVTLPSSTSVPLGTAFTVYNGCGSAVTVVPSGSDKIFPNNLALPSVSISNGDSMQFVMFGTSGGGTNGGWIVWAGAAQLQYSPLFGSSLGSNGYQKLPSGLIIQWGGNPGSNSGMLTYPFPIAFPAAVYNVSATVSNPTSVNSGRIGVISLSQFEIGNFGTSNSLWATDYIWWMAIGR
ncbi:gp53-like domain-containing protein [Trinickia fusca]|uniref:Putative tail fiber protein gp53-like C-terminal domain-containing protein n=1 Tax=Trinickia fusca TaxID=2419777 RepID=A0A494XQU4_9BURK|nr:hypothetical protein [Trinickia fusca]RKP50504.1 hypothetical protein D7S89_05205 [Trinickia fusca]